MPIQAKPLLKPFAAADITRLEDISEPVFAPDGIHVVYVVTKAGKDDASHSTLWSADWHDGVARSISPVGGKNDSHPRFSPDKHTLLFLRESGKADETQLWAMPAGGGPAHQISHIAGGTSDFSLSPDGKTAVVVAEVGHAVGNTTKVPAPIVINRFQFKYDGRGWLDDRRLQLFLLNLKTGKSEQLTHGDFDHWMPNWSPDGKWIAFVSKRCVDADRHICSDVYIMPPHGGVLKQISHSSGGNSDPDWEAGGPQWSPDSHTLVWLQAGDEKFTWYTPFQLAVADIATGITTTPARIDRWFYHPRWSHDGNHILSLIEGDKDNLLASVDAQTGAIQYLTTAGNFGYDFAESFAGQKIVIDATTTSPATLHTVGAGAHQIGQHNAWVTKQQIAETKDISFMSSGVDIHGMMLLPPDHVAGQRHPLIVRLHGGPVSQDDHELMIDWQIYAAHGYAVLSINPRGSSGRGTDFAKAQMAHWGTVDVDDVKAGIDYAINTGAVDPEHIGVGGWSYGGILTNYMITRDPRIKAAVSGAGMGNFFGGYGADQYARDYEIELGRPWDATALWQKLSYPFFESGKITAPTLYMCGDADNNVPCIGSEQMYQALRSHRVPTQLIVYPGETHHLTVPSHIRDRMQRQLDWYDRYLKAK